MSEAEKYEVFILSSMREDQFQPPNLQKFPKLMYLKFLLNSFQYQTIFTKHPIPLRLRRAQIMGRGVKQKAYKIYSLKIHFLFF